MTKLLLKQIIPPLAIAWCSIISSFGSHFDGISLGAGLINQHLNHYQTNRAGDKNKFDHHPFLSLEGSYSLNQEASWHLIAEGGFVWPGGNDHEYISKISYFANGHLAWKPSQHWQGRLGAGLFMTTISGDGGSAELRNGGSLQSFPIPKGRSTARNVTSLASLSFHPVEQYSLKFQTYVFNIANSRNRTFSYTLSLHYHFGDSLWK